MDALKKKVRGREGRGWNRKEGRRSTDFKKEGAS